MIVAVYVSLLLATAAQDPSASPDVVAPDVAQEPNGDVYSPEPGTGQDANGQDPYQVEEPAEQPVEPVEPAAAAQEEEEDVPMVCRRQTVFNDFGRQTSRKVCRPRDEW
ncbi:MAG TPA: hypothetical protein VF704_06235 [Allosphingosinicella sp.]|jgi:hypothetical protein